MLESRFEQPIYGIALLRNNVQDRYRCYNLGTFGSGTSSSSNHLVSITKKHYGEVVLKLAVSRNIYITNDPDPGNGSDWDSAIGCDSPIYMDHGSYRVQLLIVFPDVTLDKVQ